MKTKTAIWLLFYASAIFSTGSSCQSKKMEEKYDWSGTLSAPKEYPAEVYEGSLRAGDYTQHFNNWGIIASGWGDANGTVVVGPETKPVPDSLSITWFSFSEQKFYTGSFALPEENLAKLLKEGYLNEQGKKGKYDQVIIGLAPAGTIALWLMGAEKQTEVATFRGRPTEIDRESVPDDKKYMFKPGYRDMIMADTMIIPQDIRDRAAREGNTPAGHFESGYRRRYNWKPVFETGGTVESFTIDMLNGERDKLTGGRLATNNYTERAVPQTIGFYWNGADGKQHGARILFDEKEIMEGFSNMGSGSIELVLKPVDAGVVIKLTSADKETIIKNAKIKAF